MPRVLILSAAPGVPLYGPSGSSAHLRGVARAFRTMGWDAHLAVPRLADHRGAVHDPLQIPVTTWAPRRWGWMPRRFRERGERRDGARLMSRAVADFGLPDLLYERHSLFCDAGARLARRNCVPRIVELNAPQATERARWETLRDPPFAHRMERVVLQSADRVVAVSAHLAAWAIEEAGCQRDRVRHVPNGTVGGRAGDREGTRTRLGLEGLVVGFLGSLKPWHGVERIPAILDALPEATALVIGAGPVPIPAHPRILFAGRAEPAEVPDLVSAMDVGIAPYPVGTGPWFCPLKLLEYRAQGIPAVATDLGDCATLLRDGAGEVLSTDDPLAWAAAIRRQSRAARVPRTRAWTQVTREAVEGWETLVQRYTSDVALQRRKPA